MQPADNTTTPISHTRQFWGETWPGITVKFGWGIRVKPGRGIKVKPGGESGGNLAEDHGKTWPEIIVKPGRGSG